MSGAVRIGRLKDLCVGTPQYGLNTSSESYADDGIRFVRTTDITADGHLTPEADGVRVPEMLVSEDHRALPDDLLFSRSGTLGRCYRVRAQDRITFAGYLVRFRPSPSRADSRFLEYWSASKLVQDTIASEAITSTIANFNADRYANLRVPVHLLDRQRRIADFLDGETARIDALIAAKQRIVEASRERQRVWLSAQLGQGDPVAARRVTSLRTSGPRGWADQLSPSGSPFVRSQNLSSDSIGLRLDSVAFVDPPDSFEAQRSRTEPGDVLVGITGANTGWVGLVDNQISGAYVSQHVAILRPTSDVDPRWLAYSYFSHEGQSQLLGGQYGGTKQQLSLAELAAFELRVPDLSTQREAADHIDRSFAALAALASTLTTQTGLLRERRQALITAAVTGEIEV